MVMAKKKNLLQCSFSVMFSHRLKNFQTSNYRYSYIHLIHCFTYSIHIRTFKSNMVSVASIKTSLLVLLNNKVIGFNLIYSILSSSCFKERVRPILYPPTVSSAQDPHLGTFCVTWVSWWEVIVHTDQWKHGHSTQQRA